MHCDWIKFVDEREHRDSKLGYARFLYDLHTLRVPGEIGGVPLVRSYVDEWCARPECEVQKQDACSVDICVHELLVLLEGSGMVSYRWLQDGGTIRHPEQFSRFCRPEDAERRMPKAEQMFDMHGVLMEQYRR